MYIRSKQGGVHITPLVVLALIEYECMEKQENTWKANHYDLIMDNLKENSLLTYNFYKIIVNSH